MTDRTCSGLNRATSPGVDAAEAVADEAHQLAGLLVDHAEPFGGDPHEAVQSEDLRMPPWVHAVPTILQERTQPARELVGGAEGWEDEHGMAVATR